MAEMDTEAVLLGMRVAAAREKRQWDKSDLARRSRVSPSYISRLERGAYKRPSIDKIRAIADALRVSVVELTDPPTPISAAVGLHAELEALGFRPDEAPLMYEIARTIAEDDEDERRETIAAVAAILKRRGRR